MDAMAIFRVLLPMCLLLVSVHLGNASDTDSKGEPSVDKEDTAFAHISIDDDPNKARDQEGESALENSTIDAPSKVIRNHESESSLGKSSVDDPDKVRDNKGESSAAHFSTDDPIQVGIDEGESSAARLSVDDPNKVRDDQGESSSSKTFSITGKDDGLDLLELRRMLDSKEEQMIIWKVENSEAVQTELPHYNVFSTSETYILIQGRPNEKCERWLVFYWIGKKSSDADAGDAASFTVLLDAIVHSRINIHREPEGRESNAFKEAFRRVQGIAKDEAMDISTPNVRVEGIAKDEVMDTSSPNIRVEGIAKDEPMAASASNVEAEGINKDEAVGISTPNVRVEGITKDEAAGTSTESVEQIVVDVPKMFLIKEIERDVRFGKVALSLSYTDEKDACLVLMSEKVYVYCGSDAPNAPKTTAEELAKLASQLKTPETEIVSIIRNDADWSDLPEDEREILWNFTKEVDRCSLVARRLLAHEPEKIPGNVGEPWKNLPMIRIHEEKNGVVIDEIVEDTEKTISSLKTTDCYVIGIDETAGILVWMGTKSEIDEREECARRAELYLREKNYDHATSITFIDEEVMKLPPKANIGDYIRFLSGLDRPFVIPQRENLEANVTASVRSEVSRK